MKNGVQETDFIRRLQMRSADFHELKFKKDIPVAVYGTLKQGCRNHPVMEKAPLIGRGYLDNRQLRMRCTGGFPVICPSSWLTENYEVMNKVIQVELYSVKPNTLLGIDRLEGNGRLYNRRKEKVVLWDTGEIINAWTYIGMFDTFPYNNLLKVESNWHNKRQKHIVNWYPNDAIRELQKKYLGDAF